MPFVSRLHNSVHDECMIHTGSSHNIPPTDRQISPRCSNSRAHIYASNALIPGSPQGDCLTDIPIKVMASTELGSSVILSCLKRFWEHGMRVSVIKRICLMMILLPPKAGSKRHIRASDAYPVHLYSGETCTQRTTGVPPR